MGWKRINGRSYFYRSVREGGRVRSEYVGGGEAGHLFAQLIAIDRQEREAEREDRRAERERFEGEERAIAEWFDRVEAVADAAMLAAGFHKHHGQWRRRRDGGGEQRGDGGDPRDGGGQASGEAVVG
jgi:hypothetical protein